MAPSVIFYNDLLSQPCRAVYVFMKANNIPFRSVKVDLMAGEQYQGDFTKVSSIQRVPVIEDDGFVLGESASIFRYLSKKYAVAEHWYPSKDLKQQARIDEYLHWHHVIRYPAMVNFRHQYFNVMRGKAIKNDKVERAKEDLRKAIKHIETYFLKGKQFLCGSEISVADLQAVCELMQLNTVGDESMYTSNPKVNAWFQRVRVKLQPTFDECNDGSIMMMRNMYMDTIGSKL